MFKQGYKSLV